MTCIRYDRVLWRNLMIFYFPLAVEEQHVDWLWPITSLAQSSSTFSLIIRNSVEYFSLSLLSYTCIHVESMLYAYVMMLHSSTRTLIQFWVSLVSRRTWKRDLLCNRGISSTLLMGTKVMVIMAHLQMRS